MQQNSSVEGLSEKHLDLTLLVLASLLYQILLEIMNENANELLVKKYKKIIIIIKGIKTVRL